MNREQDFQQRLLSTSLKRCNPFAATNVYLIIINNLII